MTLFRIPKNWTVDQADAVMDFLFRLAEAIWEQYEDAFVMQQLQRLTDDDSQSATEDPWCDDDIPF